MTKVVMACKTCGGTNVTRDSVSRWNVETQQWEHGDELDGTDCIECGETELVEVVAYTKALERLWDMLSDTVEGGRLTEADCPDDYEALVHQMVACEQARDADAR